MEQNYEDWSTFADVIVKIKIDLLFGDTVYIVYLSRSSGVVQLQHSSKTAGGRASAKAGFYCKVEYSVVAYLQ